MYGTQHRVRFYLPLGCSSLYKNIILLGSTTKKHYLGRTHSPQLYSRVKGVFEVEGLGF